MLVHPQFDPVALQLGPLAIHWYGLMYLAGFMTFLWLGRKRIAMLNNAQDARRKAQDAKKSERTPSSQPLVPFTAKLLDDLLFYGVLGVILGGRLGYVLFYLSLIHISEPTRLGM